MKNRLLLLSSLICICIVPNLRADASVGQKEVTKKLTDEIHARPMTEKDYQDLCGKVLSSSKAKRLMCDLLLKDPEATQYLRSRK